VDCTRPQSPYQQLDLLALWRKMEMATGARENEETEEAGGVGAVGWVVVSL
jgi:hypothetical protein